MRQSLIQSPKEPPDNSFRIGTTENLNTYKGIEYHRYAKLFILCFPNSHSEQSELGTLTKRADLKSTVMSKLAIDTRRYYQINNQYVGHKIIYDIGSEVIYQIRNNTSSKIPSRKIRRLARIYYFRSPYLELTIGSCHSRLYELRSQNILSQGVFVMTKNIY